jgi:hypothetical protein
MPALPETPPDARLAEWFGATVHPLMRKSRLRFVPFLPTVIYYVLRLVFALLGLWLRANPDNVVKMHRWLEPITVDLAPEYADGYLILLELAEQPITTMAPELRAEAAELVRQFATGRLRFPGPSATFRATLGRR